MNDELFELDDANILHVAEHGATAEDAEQVILNRPVDLGSELRGGEPRVAQIGETNEGHVLVVISTTSGKRIRVVTAWRRIRVTAVFRFAEEEWQCWKN